MLHGSAESDTINPHKYCAEIQKVAHFREVMQIGPPSKRTKVDGDTAAITFTDEDLTGVQTPHNDALVVTLWMVGCDVKRLLIDQGSSSEVMYYDLLKKLELTDADLQPSNNPLVGFIFDLVWPLEKVTIPITAGGITIQTKFLMVNVPSPYNAIMGRTWLYHMKAIPSTYHQLIRFPTLGGVGEIRGDQVAVNQCFLTAYIPKEKVDKVHMMELHEVTPTIDDVGQTPEDKAVEDLKKIYIDQHNEKYFVIGTFLSKAEENSLVELLTRYLEVFAWTPYGMLGIDAEIACHKLNVDPQY